MTKGTTSRRGRTRPDTPRTIDLAASEVTPAPDAGTPEPEPVAMDEAGSPQTGLSGFGATASVETPSDTGAETPGDGPQDREPGKASESSASPSAATGSAGAWGRGNGTSGKPPAAPANSRGGLAGMLLSGLVGALVALVLLGGLATAGLLRHVPLLAALSPVERTQAPDLSADVAALDKRLATLEATTRASPQGPDLSELTARLDALDTRLDNNEKATENGASGAQTSGSDELAARVDELEQRLSTVESLPGATSDSGASQEALAGLREKVDDLSASVQSSGETANAMSGRIDALETKLDGLEDKLAANSADAKARAEAEQTARGVAVDALRAAYRRGEPFAEFLDSLATLGAPSAAIEALRPYAASGVATDAELVDGFDTASRQALDALAPQGDGVMSRLLANARSLVDVRPAGPVEGDEPNAVLSRVENDLANGDFPAALAEWQFLPEEARKAAAGFEQKLAARVAADKALREIAGAAKSDG